MVVEIRLEEISRHCSDRYCLFVEILRHRRLIDGEDVSYCCGSSNGECQHKRAVAERIKDPRALVQMECVERYKWLLSEELRRDVGWSGAWDSWVSEGYAESFGRVYDSLDNPDSLPCEEIFKRVSERRKQIGFVVEWA
jgi:hypothetical protein